MFFPHQNLIYHFPNSNLVPKVTFNNGHQLFFQAVKKSVDEYFSRHNKLKTGNWELYWKAIILIPLALACYLYLLLGNYYVVPGILLSAFLGFVLITIAFNVMHDACHGSYSSRKWVNEIMGLTMNALGSTSFIWKIKHNIIHHTYTNVDGVDDDIAKSPMLRHCASQKWFPWHRFQFVYMFFFYGISSISWMLVFDYIKYFSKKINTTPISKISTGEHFIFWISKLLYVLFYALIPILLVGWQAWLTGFLVMHAVMGLTLAMVFQLAHVVEKAKFEKAGDGAVIINSEWAVHELMTTSNFALKNKVISWLVGGLNFQIEHHLFPRISHVHYPALSIIVREQCDKFQLPYNNYRTMSGAIISHIRLMKQLGLRHQVKNS
jgi:linoleoyl-CoA desaturase